MDKLPGSTVAACSSIRHVDARVRQRFVIPHQSEAASLELANNLCRKRHLAHFFQYESSAVPRRTRRALLPSKLVERIDTYLAGSPTLTAVDMP